MKKNYLSTSQNKSKKNNDNIDLKEEFQEMLKETTISEEEVKNRKKEEEMKSKETLDKAKKEWEEKNESLKNEWEKTRSNVEENPESDLKINHLKKKLTSVFYFNKSSKNEEKKGDKENNADKTEEISEPSKISQFVSGFVKVWKQTFPGEENLELLLERRKAEAQILKSKIKEPTEEEIAEIEAAIPEWKRGAVVMVLDQPVEEVTSIFDTAKLKMKSHVKNLKIYKEAQTTLQNSELNLLVEDLKQSFTNVKDNLNESQNPFFVVSRDLMDRAKFKSPSAQAITVMRKHDPDFDLILFEREVDAIFKQLMHAFVKDDLDTIRLITGETALAVLSNEIKSRRERVNLVY